MSLRNKCACTHCEHVPKARKHPTWASAQHEQVQHVNISDMFHLYIKRRTCNKRTS